ncbi:PREDICTED: UPF0496 protein At5g66675-like [Tarenaya hassleriana]|uniref:UPF0496 protein At5g66675-like n=1 Tax=Tarenaya hassleriana TaxID=28532 RepID=UPI00053C7D3C|nr:PREDICTED: UPF0496 protein At5g66675-like [Tarenaya hassleriana]
MAGERSLSFDSLRQVTGSMLELNNEVVKIILEVKQEEFKSESFMPLMKAYMDASLRNLDLCSTLERCIKYARDGQFTIHLHLREAVEDGDQNKILMTRAKEELTKLRTEDNPFPQHVSDMFDATHHRLESLIVESNNQTRGIDRKLKRIETWSKLSTVLFAIGYFSVLVLTGVSLAVNVPSPVEILASALLATIGSMGKWTNYYCKQEEKRIRRVRESLVVSVRTGAYVMLRDMDNVKIIVEKWRAEMEILLKKAEAVLREEEEMGEMMREWETFQGMTEELDRNVSKVSEDTRRARTVSLQRILQVNSSEEDKITCLEIIM